MSPNKAAHPEIGRDEPYRPSAIRVRMISAVVIFSPIAKNSKNGITIGTMHAISVAFAAWVHCAPCVQAMKWKASIVAGKNVSRKLRPEYSPRYFLKLRA